MKTVFLGTAAGKPSNHRNVTSIAVIFEDSEFVLVDCGEATQHQIMNSTLKLSKLKAIYITHLHGDHIFGLPGLLCTLNEIRTDKLTVFGPRGLKEYLKFTNRFINNYQINIQECGYNFEHFTVARHFSGNYEYTVEFATVEHGITCFAYKIIQVRVNPQVDMDILYPHIDYHRHELEKMGFLPAEKIINTLKTGTTITLKNGFCFDGKNYMKRYNDVSLVIALDNYNSDKMKYYFNKCDVIIHECTYAILATMSEKEKEETKTLAHKHKHSTNSMAYEVAAKLNAHHLILTHFSNRYTFDDEPSIIAGSFLNNQGTAINVECARDFSEFCICSK